MLTFGRLFHVGVVEDNSMMVRVALLGSIDGLLSIVGGFVVFVFIL